MVGQFTGPMGQHDRDYHARHHVVVEGEFDGESSGRTAAWGAKPNRMVSPMDNYPGRPGHGRLLFVEAFLVAESPSLEAAPGVRHRHLDRSALYADGKGNQGQGRAIFAGGG